MTNEEKQILLKDLCARLPYGVKALVQGWDEDKGEVKIDLKIYSVNTDGYVYFEDNDYDVNYLMVDGVKPYLRPMSSVSNMWGGLTEEEIENPWILFDSPVNALNYFLIKHIKPHEFPLSHSLYYKRL